MRKDVSTRECGDGYGDRCDAKFPGVTGAVVGARDLARFRTALGKSGSGDNCGTTGTEPRAIFGPDEANGVVNAGDPRRHGGTCN